jgi:hypothetical protein
MPAPKRPNTAAATAAVRRRGDETAAARLRAHGWLAVPPERIAAWQRAVLVDQHLPGCPAAFSDDGGPCRCDEAENLT